MSKPLRRTVGGIALLVLGAASGIGADRLWQFRHGAAPAQEKVSTAKPAPGDDEEEPEPAAVVRTAVAVQGELRRTVEALGVAATPPTAAFVESWPVDVIITRVLVQQGETISKDAPLVQVSLTREAQMQAAAAQVSLDNATKTLELVQQRLERGLATRTDVLAAQTARDDAGQRLDHLRAGSPPQDGLLRSRSSGVVATVRVQAGATVPAGTPMVDISSGAVVAQIGIDPADVTGLTIGQTFDVRAIDDRAAARWSGVLSLLASAVNPTTRLVDATLTLTGDSFPRVGTPLRALAGLPGAVGVIIPRAALVPDGDNMVVFIVRDGTAVLTPVIIAQRGDEQVSVASGCAAGDRVVVSGQSQLTTGAVVRELTAEPRPAKRNGGPGADR